MSEPQPGPSLLDTQALLIVPSPALGAAFSGKGLKTDVWGVLFKEAGLLAPALCLGAPVHSGPWLDGSHPGQGQGFCLDGNSLLPMEANPASDCDRRAECCLGAVARPGW